MSRAPWPGIFFVGEDALIERNVIRVTTRREEVAGREIEGITASAGLGGLQLGGACERVRVINNLIQRGIGNGITLGNIQIVDEEEDRVVVVHAWYVNADDPCGPCRDGSLHIPPRLTVGDDGGGTREESAGDLSEIYIEGNRIQDMGLCGIGVVGFFDLQGIDEFISVERLSIIGNEIRRCLRRPLDPVPSGMIDSMGYGGIALADVEHLVVLDNVIEDNGPNYLEPICGIFVLHGEGIDISRNRIRNNGASTTQSPNDAKEGRRGGINVVYGIAPTESVTIDGQQYPVQNGVPAIRVHENIVSVPLGQALSLTALGPVLVVGNQLTSSGMIMNSSSPQPSFFASTVAIWNWGISTEFNGQLLSFNALREGQTGRVRGSRVTDEAVILPQEGLDDLLFGRYLANGNVLFSNNQCVLDLRETGRSISVTSLFILSIDDIGFHNNQCDCHLVDDFVISHAFLFGGSVRMSDNRLKEDLNKAVYSAISMGLMNATTNNQATHCVIVSGIPGVKVDSGNKIVLQILNESDRCRRLNPFDDTDTTFGRATRFLG